VPWEDAGGGWYRVWAAAICGGGEVRATVRGEQLQATVEAVCGWALLVARG